MQLRRGAVVAFLLRSGAPWHAPSTRPRRSPSSTWARTASASRLAASKAIKFFASIPGARIFVSAPASTSAAVSRRKRGAPLLPVSRVSPSASRGCIRRQYGRSRPTPFASPPTRRRSCRRPSAHSDSQSTSSPATRKRGLSTTASLMCYHPPPSHGSSSTSAADPPNSSLVAGSNLSASSRCRSVASD